MQVRATCLCMCTCVCLCARACVARLHVCMHAFARVRLCMHIVLTVRCFFPQHLQSPWVTAYERPIAGQPKKRGESRHPCHDCATCAACDGLRHATASSLPMRATSATRVTVRALARPGLCACARVCKCVRKRAGALACMRPRAHAPVFAWCAHVCRWGCVLVRSCARGHVRARAYCAAQGPPEDCIEPECCTVPPHPHTYGLLYAPEYPSGSGGDQTQERCACDGRPHEDPRPEEPG